MLRNQRIREIKAVLSLAELEKIEKDTQAEEQKSGHHEMAHDPEELISGQPLKQGREKHEIGRVAFKVYKEYLLYGASAIVLFIFILVFFSGQGKEIDPYCNNILMLKWENVH